MTSNPHISCQLSTSTALLLPLLQQANRFSQRFCCCCLIFAISITIFNRLTLSSSKPRIKPRIPYFKNCIYLIRWNHLIRSENKVSFFLNPFANEFDLSTKDSHHLQILTIFIEWTWAHNKQNSCAKPENDCSTSWLNECSFLVVHHINFSQIFDFFQVPIWS